MRFLWVILGTVAVAGLFFFGVFLLDPTITLDEEEAVRLELQETTSSEDLARRIENALEEDDVDTATMYAEIADFAGFILPEETKQALIDANAFARRVTRTGSQVAGGFFTGEANSLAGLTGAVISDLTVVGDVRDIINHGGRMIADEPYSELILGLSVVGLAATGATVATGGVTITGRVGVTLLKVAAKTGSLTADFSRVLGRKVRDAVNFPMLQQTLRQVRLTDTAATRNAMQAYARNVRSAELVPVVARMNDMRNSTNAVEAVRLMRYVRTTDDLNDVARMSQRLGTRTRGVIEITGKTSLRAFRTTVKLLDFILKNILAFLSWLGGVVALWFSRFLTRAAKGRR